MHDAFFVRRVQRIRQLHADLHGSRNRAFSRRQRFVQRLAFEQLHGDKRHAFMFFDGINGAYPWMIQRRSRARFAQKTLQRLRIAIRFLGEKFQRHAPAEFRIFGFVHHAHAAAANFAQNLVVADGLVDHRFSLDHDVNRKPKCGQSIPAHF